MTPMMAGAPAGAFAAQTQASEQSAYNPYQWEAINGTPAAPQAAPQQAYQPPSLQNQVANTYNGAVNGTNMAMGMNLGMQPMMANTTHATAPAAQTQQGYAQGYNAFTGLNPDGTAMTGFGGGNATGGGYTAEQMAAARDVAAGQLSNTDMNPYLNPYTDNVINQTSADMERARLIEQNQANDAMQNAGAFGGSRHGVANAETNRNFYDRLGSTVGQLRNLGFENAQQAALSDIGNRMQTDMANQNMDYNVGSFNAGQVNDARRTGANNRAQASMANANNAAQMAALRMGAINEASRFGAGAFNDMSQFNANQGNNMNQFNSQLAGDLSRYNAGESNANSRFNSDTYNQFGQNQFNNQMNASGRLADLSGQGFDMANSISRQQALDGALARGVDQSVIDDAMRQFDNYSNAGNLGLGNLQNGVASTPNAGTTTSTSSPGATDLLGIVL